MKGTVEEWRKWKKNGGLIRKESIFHHAVTIMVNENKSYNYSTSKNTSIIQLFHVKKKINTEKSYTHYLSLMISATAITTTHTCLLHSQSLHTPTYTCPLHTSTYTSPTACPYTHPYTHAPPQLVPKPPHSQSLHNPKHHLRIICCHPQAPNEQQGASQPPPACCYSTCSQRCWGTHMYARSCYIALTQHWWMEGVQEWAYGAVWGHAYATHPPITMSL